LTNDDNLLYQVYNDLNNGVPVSDNDGSPLTPYDSLYKWGRKITGINRNYNISEEGDSIKYLVATTTFTGNMIIIGYQNGVLDTTSKPFTESLKRKSVFKRIGRNNHPRYNWRLYSLSGLDGETTSPQLGSSKVRINKVEIYKNNSSTPTYSFTGPDFTDITFITKKFGGVGIPVLDRNDQIKVKIYTTSQDQPVDYVAFHWAKNSFGFHRIPFALESETGSGPYDRIYSKSFNIYGNHLRGTFNAYFSASTHQSLYDDDITLLASDLVGLPFRVTQ